MLRTIKIMALGLALNLSMPFVLNIFLGKYLRPGLLWNYCIYVFAVLFSIFASLLMAIMLYEMIMLYKKKEQENKA